MSESRPQPETTPGPSSDRAPNARPPAGVRRSTGGDKREGNETALSRAFARAVETGLLGGPSLSEHARHARAMAAGAMGMTDGTEWLDLGSGAGMPGLVVAYEFPDLRVALLDASRRRCRVAAEGAADLGVAERVVVVHARAEDAARRADLRSRFDVVLSRSFGAPPVTAECAVGFLALGGVLVVSEPPETESTRWDPVGLDRLGLEAQRRPPSAVALAVFRKRRDDDQWPRANGMPQKHPLW